MTFTGQSVWTQRQYCPGHIGIRVAAWASSVKRKEIALALRFVGDTIQLTSELVAEEVDFEARVLAHPVAGADKKTHRNRGILTILGPLWNTAYAFLARAFSLLSLSGWLLCLLAS